MMTNETEMVQNEQSDLVKPCTALCSLSDMDKSAAFFKELLHILPQLKIYATEGTATRLNAFLSPATEQKKAAVTSLNEYISPHRGTLDIVKTLDTRIFSGILADRENHIHQEAIAEQQLVLFDIVIVNFYTEKIDIGGPAMLRAAAKNARYVTAIGSPQQYESLLVELRSNLGATGYTFRRRCALLSIDIAATYIRTGSQHIPRTIA